MSVNVLLAILHICLAVKGKKMKKTAKNNDQNNQISALFGIFRQILENIYLQDVYNCKIYIKIYICI